MCLTCDERKHIVFLVALVPLLVIEVFLPFHADADTTISGTISSNTTWTTAGNVYIIQGLVTINSGVTLTVDPGVIVKFQGSSSQLTVNGTLDAEGTSTDPIYFTSYKDDAVGGDTNGDGGASTPAPGDWIYIRVNSGGSANIGHAIVRYGGYHGSSDERVNIYNAGGVLSIASSTIAYSDNHGMRNGAGTTTATNVTLSNNDFSGLYQTGGFVSLASSTVQNNDHGTYNNSSASKISLVNNTFIDNGTAVRINDPDQLDAHYGNIATSTGSASNGIFVSGVLDADATWEETSMPYIVGWLTIGSDVSLSFEPGAVIKLAGTDSELIVSGSLTAHGTLADPIYFTSYKDDDAGGDANGDGSASSPAPGNWRHIDISGGTLDLAHAVIRYGGSSPSPGSKANINLRGGGILTIASSTVAHSGQKGIQQSSGTTTATNIVLSENDNWNFIQSGGVVIISSSTIQDATYGISTSGSGKLSFFDTDFIGHNIAVEVQDPDILQAHSGNTASSSSVVNGIWVRGTLNADKVWTADTMPYVLDVSSVTVASGATLSLDPGAIVKLLDGSASLFVNGTLDALGTSLEPIYFTSYKDDAAGGDTNGDGGTSSPAPGNWRHINIGSGGTANLEHAIVRYGGSHTTSSQRANVYNNGGTLTIATSTISHGNVYGVRQNSGTTAIVDSVIKDNGTYGAYNVLTSTSTFTATNNYWDAFSGPYHATYNASGTGDDVSSYIAFDPWLGQLNYTSSDNAVDSGPNIHWGGSTVYSTAWANAVTLWNSLGAVGIEPDTLLTIEDLTISDVNTDAVSWSALYTYDSVDPDTIEFNRYYLDQSWATADVLLNTALHELGHALGLRHSYWGNVLYEYSTTQTTFGDQDLADYDLLW